MSEIVQISTDEITFIGGNNDDGIGGPYSFGTILQWALGMPKREVLEELERRLDERDPAIRARLLIDRDVPGLDISGEKEDVAEAVDVLNAMLRDAGATSWDPTS